MPTTDFAGFETDLARLAAKFDKEFKTVSGPGYPEARLRDDYLNPLLRALGWDLENAAGRIQSQRDVEIESRTDIDGRAKRADYLFRTDGRDRFVCEAKKPDSRLGPRDAFQAKRYAFNMGLPLAVLSDFEEIKVYVVGGRPHIDRPAEGLWKTWHYQQYPLVAEEIWRLLARENIAAGSIDTLLDSLPKRASAARGGKARQVYLIRPDRNRSLDADFLNFLDEARHDLASSILQHNPRADVLEDDRLNAAAQHILDRLLFIRICEDRDIDTGTRLVSLVDLWRRKFNRPGTLPPKQASFLADADADAPRDLPPETLWSAVVAHFRALDHRPPGNVPFFNGQLFKPHFSEELLVGDRWLADFIAQLSDDESPYLFNIIPVEILGSVYERFLGKVIRPHGRGVKTEEKPEVRKAGGVYYTPRYIVDYIVEQTVGKIVGEIIAAAPKFAALEKRSRAVRILDPACGSGSFLIRAFERMCEHWLAWFTAHPEDRRKHLCRVDDKTNDVHLTVELKRQILCDNIFGVDLDAQAVEVTQLSLYLKMLEGETRQTLAREFNLEKAVPALLPPLAANIKWGNSIIASDFSLVAEDLERVRAFNWEIGFREIMRAGGFDAVIGNPPYVFTRNHGIPEDEKAYFYSTFIHQSTQLNTFGIFLERSHSLLKPGARLGFITPNNWLTIDTFAPLRKFLIDAAGNLKITNILDRVFEAADVDTCVVCLRKVAPDHLTISEMNGEKELYAQQVSPAEIRPPGYIIQINLLRDSDAKGVLEKVEQRSQPLSIFATVSTGLKVYQIGKGKPIQTAKQKDGRVFHSTTKLSKSCGKYLDGVNVSRYHLGWSGEWLDYGDWIAEPRRSVPFTGNRLLVRQIPGSPPYLVHGVFTDEPYYNDINSMVVFDPLGGESLKYLLGILNSRVVSFWFRKKFDKLQRKIFPQFKVKELAEFPIVEIKPADKKLHDKLVTLVDKMLILAPQLRAEMNDAKRAVLENAVAATDHQIDVLVYQLYDLSPEEIALVETARA